MRNYLLIGLIVFGAFCSQAQEADTVFIQLFGIGGGYGATSNGNSLSYSMGELMVETASNYNQNLTQGFQQNSFKAIVGIIEVKDVTINVEAYPNPTTEFLNIKISGKNTTLSAKEYDLTLYDMLGKEVQLDKNWIDDQTIRLDLKQIPTGMYMVNFREIKSTKIISNFKVTKTENN